jgi:hypothetical protein
VTWLAVGLVAFLLLAIGALVAIAEWDNRS